MNQVSTKRTEEAIIAEAHLAFRAEHGPGPIPLSGVVRHIFDNPMWEPPTERQLKRQCLAKVSRYMKKLKVRDKQNRIVRAMQPAKYPTLSGGQTVLWDDHFEMSLEHGIKSFTKRAELVLRSQKSLERDFGSFIDNNPNAAGQSIQLELLFESVNQDAATKQNVEEIPSSESTILSRPLPR